MKRGRRRYLIMLKNKKCLRCRREKDMEEFPLSKWSKDGRYRWCQDCYNDTHTNTTVKPRGKKSNPIVEVELPKSKVCIACGKDKPIILFYRDGANRFRDTCKVCDKERAVDNVKRGRQRYLEKYSRKGKELS